MKTLPYLKINRLHIAQLMAEPIGCFSLGILDDGSDEVGFIVIRPADEIPIENAQNGFAFGHSVIGPEKSPVLHFAFNFYGHKTFHGLVATGNEMAKRVVRKMIQRDDYFFMVINPDERVVTFRSKGKFGDLAGLKLNQENYNDSYCDIDHYELVNTAFCSNPNPPGEVLRWVCRDNLEYLDLDLDVVQMNPSGQ